MNVMKHFVMCASNSKNYQLPYGVVVQQLTICVYSATRLYLVHVGPRNKSFKQGLDWKG